MHAANYYREVGGGVCAPIYPIKSHSLAMLLLSSRDLLLSCLNSLLGKLSQNLDANPLPELHFPTPDLHNHGPQTACCMVTCSLSSIYRRSMFSACGCMTRHSTNSYVSGLYKFCNIVTDEKTTSLNVEELE